MNKLNAGKVKKETHDGNTEKVLQIRRVNKVVKGGKRLAFRATVVVGDMNGAVGVGVGKATEVPSAIRKAIDDAKKQMYSINITEDTIPHEITGRFNASKVFLKPAPRGTGVIAGGAARIILELAGIKNVVAKSQASGSVINAARATLDGLVRLREAQEVANKRGRDFTVVFHGDKKPVKFAPLQEAGKKEEVKQAAERSGSESREAEE